MPGLVVLEDTLSGGERLALAAAHRIVYVVSGAVGVTTAGGPPSGLGENEAWYGADAASVQARLDARLWRWELRRETDPPAAESPRSRLKLAQAVELPPGGRLMRCDRVDFPPGGVAYTHTHQGPGIRVLLCGRFRVEVDGHARDIAPGQAWFERGPDPVYAAASADEATSFVRVMILPVALLGKSSIRYVKPEDQARPKSQRSTVFVDSPIAS